MDLPLPQAAIPQSATSHVPIPRTKVSIPPLKILLQVLSDYCTTARQCHTTVYTAVLTDAIRRHLIIPLRRGLHATSSSVPNSASRSHSLTLIITQRILQEALPPEPAPPLPSHQVYELLHHTILILPTLSHAFSTLTAIWSDVISIFICDISLWLTHAVAPSHFFINDSAALCQSQIPSFLSLRAAVDFSFAGEATKCARQLSPSSVLPAAPTLERLVKQPISATLTLDAAATRQRTQAATILSSVLPFPQICTRINSLRRYLLHGDALFWRLFFDRLRPHQPMLTSDMSAEERESMQNLLNALVVEVCADLHINLPFSVSLSPTADLVPAFQLSYAESMLLAPRASVYCDVFSITFSTRRTACELRAAFAHLQYLHRVSRSLSPRLVFLRELRRKMAHFVDAFEYYVQEEVLEPKFQRLFDVLAAGPQQRDCKDDTPFYDVVYNLHNRLMDKIFQQCFVGEPQIYTQLNAIFTACLSLSTFAQELDVDSLHHQDFERTTAAIRIKFERNLALLVRLLSHSKMGAADSRIPALLLRINFKNFKSF